MPVIIAVWDARGELLSHTQFDSLDFGEIDWAIRNTQLQYPEAVRVAVDIALPYGEGKE